MLWGSGVKEPLPISFLFSKTAHILSISPTMEFIKKNKFLAYFAGLMGINLAVGIATIFFLGFSYLPQRNLKEKEFQCLNHLEQKSYQLKQFFLENINNSRLWVNSQKNSFFDSRWLGIAFYEHNGSEWILKNFQVNSVVLDLYNISSSEFIKLEQNLISPHPDAEQISLQEDNLLDQKVLVIESSNNMQLKTPHMVRISILSDQVRSLLDSNETCALSLFDPSGHFLLNKLSTQMASSYIESSEQPQLLENEIETLDLKYYQAYTKRILKNVSVVHLLKSSENIYAGAFAQILFFNMIGLLISTYLAFRILRQRFQSRLHGVKTLISDFAHQDFSHRFGAEVQDEFSEIEESLSEMKDLSKQRNRK